MCLCVDGLEANVPDRGIPNTCYSQTLCEDLPVVLIDDKRLKSTVNNGRLGGRRSTLDLLRRAPVPAYTALSVPSLMSDV